MMPFNVLLDEYPEEYKGYPINSDYRIGIQMIMAIQDPELTQREQGSVCAELLFGGHEEFPDAQVMVDGIAWFLSGWAKERAPEKKRESRDMDYDIDQWRIYSAFLSQYRIDLNTERMHFWRFMGLLTTLEECAFTRVVGLRTEKIPKELKGEARKRYMEQKRRYELEDPESIEEQEERRRIVDEFLSKTTINRGNSNV